MGKNKAVKPTLAQKKRITDAGLGVNNWLVLKESEDELLLVSRNSGRFRRIKKSPCRKAGRPGKIPDIIVKRADENVNQNLKRSGKDGRFI